MVMDNNWITVVSILQDTQMSNYYIVHLKLTKLCQFYISTKKKKTKNKKRLDMKKQSSARINITHFTFARQPQYLSSALKHLP